MAISSKRIFDFERSTGMLRARQKSRTQRSLNLYFSAISVMVQISVIKASPGGSGRQSIRRCAKISTRPILRAMRNVV
jgi:hypothetical protein